MKVQSLMWMSLAVLALSACGAQAEEASKKDFLVAAPAPQEATIEAEKAPTKPSDDELTGVHAARYQQLELIEAELQELASLHEKLLDQPKVAEAFAAGTKFASESKSLVEEMQTQEPESIEAQISRTRLIGKSGAFLAPLGTLVKLLPKDKVTQEHLQTILTAVETLRSL